MTRLLSLMYEAIRGYFFVHFTLRNKVYETICLTLVNLYVKVLCFGSFRHWCKVPVSLSSRLRYRTRHFMDEVGEVYDNTRWPLWYYMMIFGQWLAWCWGYQCCFRLVRRWLLWYRLMMFGRVVRLFDIVWWVKFVVGTSHWDGCSRGLRSASDDLGTEWRRGVVDVVVQEDCQVPVQVMV